MSTKTSSRLSVSPLFVADDWGLSKEINQAILFLAQLGKISRISIMVNLPYTDFLLDKLLKLNINLSLHFNLTTGVRINSKTYNLRDLLLGKMERTLIEDELRFQIRQLALISPNSNTLESHEYIHLIPNIARTIVPILLKENYLVVRYVKSARPLLARLGSIYCFEKIYRFQDGFKKAKTTTSIRYDSKIPVIIHPACAISNDASDPWRSRRYSEYLKIIGHFSTNEKDALRSTILKL